MPSETPRPPSGPCLLCGLPHKRSTPTPTLVRCDCGQPVFSGEAIDHVLRDMRPQEQPIWEAARSELAALREQVKQASNLLAVANDPDPLTNRLRGTYRLEDGSSRSFARFVPPIQVVAAAEIDRLRNEVTQARNAALEEAAMLHEQIPNHCSHEINCPGCGAIGAIVRYRDAIRALKGS